MKFLILPIIAILMFSSCSEDSDINTTENENRHSRVHFVTLEEYAEKHLTYTNKIYDILADYYLKDQNFILELDRVSKFTNEDELFDYMSEIGINSESQDTLVYLMKQDMILHENLNKTNVDFASLKLTDKKIAIKDAIINSPLFPESDNNMIYRTCIEQWNVDISRCKRDYAIETGISIIGGVLTGGVGGLIGYTAATIHWTFCLSDAKDDYYACKKDKK